MKRCISILSALMLIITLFTAMSVATYADEAACTTKIPSRSYIEKPEGLELDSNNNLFTDGTNKDTSARFSRGTGVEGGYLIYAIPPTKELRATAVVHNTSPLHLTFEISTDMESWSELDMTYTPGADVTNPGKACVYYGSSSDAFNYVKVSFPKQAWVPVLCNLYVNPVTDVYPNKTVGGTGYIDKTSDAALSQADANLIGTDQTRGYRFPSGKNGSSCYATYSVPMSRTLMVTGITQTNSAAAAGRFTFDVSDDGVNWRPINMYYVFGATQIGGTPTGFYTCNYYGSSPKPFIFVRVNFACSSWYPIICNVYTNTIANQQDSYEVKKTALQADAASSDGGTLFAHPEVSDYYYFSDAEKNATRYNGILTFKSDYPITDYHFRTLISNISYGGKIKFYASKNGKDFFPITPAKSKTDSGKSGWDASYNDDYDTFLAKDGIYYLRAEYAITGGAISAGLPTLAFCEFNYEENAFDVTVVGSAGGTVEVDVDSGLDKDDVVTVTVTPDLSMRLKGGMLYYTANGIDYPIHKRVGSVAFDKNVSVNNEETLNQYFFEMPAADVTIEARFVSDAFDSKEEAQAASGDILGVFGVSRRIDITDPGLQFGSRAYRKLKIGNDVYELQTCGTILLRGENYETALTNVPRTGEWLSWLADVKTWNDDNGSTCRVLYKNAPTQKLLDRCIDYVDFSVRLINLEGEFLTAKYRAVAYAEYKCGDDILRLESEAPFRAESWE